MTYLTERQRDVLDFVARFQEEHGVAPTLREIAEHFGFSSTASAQKHVRLLVEKGLLRKAKHQKRGLELAEGDRSRVPLLGTVAAGSPIESYSGEETIPVPQELLGAGDHYALRVRGDSMIEEGIHDGDVVLVRRRESASDGEVVVALVDSEATLKRIYRGRRRTVRLEPANAAMEPLVVAADRVRVQGVVVGLIRRY